MGFADHLVGLRADHDISARGGDFEPGRRRNGALRQAARAGAAGRHRIAIARHGAEFLSVHEFTFPIQRPGADGRAEGTVVGPPLLLVDQTGRRR